MHVPPVHAHFNYFDTRNFFIVVVLREINSKPFYFPCNIMLHDLYGVDASAEDIPPYMASGNY